MELVKTRRLAAIHPPSPVAFTFAVCATEDKTADIKRLRLVSKGDRNRRIGEFLKELDITEARNTGYSVILGATKANGSPKPILETNTHRDYFTFILPIHEMFLKSDAETVRELNVTDSVEGVNEGVNEGETVIQILLHEPFLSDPTLSINCFATRDFKERSTEAWDIDNLSETP